MKNIFFSGGIIFLIAGLGLQQTVTPVKAETAKQVLDSTPKTDAIAQPQIQLLNPGTGERHQLRYQPPVNFTQTAIMTTNMNMAMSIAGKPLPAFKVPVTVMTMQAKVTKVDKNGDIYYEFSYPNVDVMDDPKISPQVITAVRSQIKQLGGITGDAVVDNRGYTKQANIVLPKGLNANLKQIMQQMLDSIKQMSLPVPQEAVGVGSQWQATSMLNISGLNIKQIATYQLVGFKNGIATLNTNIVQTALPAQHLTTPGLPSGVKIDLKSYDGMGQGQVTMGLNQLMPIHSTMSIHNSIETSQNPGKAGQAAINQKVSLSMEMIIDSK